MYCSNCGTRNDFDAKYCQKCGLNFNKENRKAKNKIKLQKNIEKVFKNIDYIVLGIIIVFTMVFVLIYAYNQNKTVKFRKYLEKEKYSCSKNICSKKVDNYDIKIEYKKDRIIYTSSKVNEEIRLNYAGKDLGMFYVKDSLSEFICPYVDSKINYDVCEEQLKKAGAKKYKTKMNDILKEVSNISKKI